MTARMLTVGGSGGTRAAEAAAYLALTNLGAYLVRIEDDTMTDPDGVQYRIITPVTHPLQEWVVDRVFENITEVEKFIRLDCSSLRTWHERAKLQQEIQDIVDRAPGILRIELTKGTITEVVCPDGSRITIKTDALGAPRVEVPRAVWTRAELEPGRCVVICNDKVTKHGHRYDNAERT
jgi:hypothetical protein